MESPPNTRRAPYPSILVNDDLDHQPATQNGRPMPRRTREPRLDQRPLNIREHLEPRHTHSPIPPRTIVRHASAAERGGLSLRTATSRSSASSVMRGARILRRTTRLRTPPWPCRPTATPRVTPPWTGARRDSWELQRQRQDDEDATLRALQR